MNELKSVNYSGPFGEEQVICAMLTIDNLHSPFVLHNISEVNKEYTFSLYIRSDADGSITVGGETIETTTEWTNHAVTFIADCVDVSIFFNVIGTYYLYNTQLETGNRDTDWRPAVEDVDLNISAAGKTATNYLEFSNGGLIVGDHTSGTLGRNILVGSEYIDIRSGENTLARYADKNIHLGMDSTDSAIYLCGDVGKMSVTNGGWLQLETTGVLSLYSGSQTHIETKYVSGNPSSVISESRISTYATDSSASVMISSTAHNNLLGDTYIHVLPTEIELRAFSGAYEKTIGLELDAVLSEVRISDGRLYVVNGQGVFDGGVAIYNGANISGTVNMNNGLTVEGSTTIGSALAVSGTISEGGTALSDKYIGLAQVGTYPRMTLPNSYQWLRLADSGGGILPYSQISPTGDSYIGASGWPFKYINAIQHMAESSSNTEVGFYAYNTAHKGCFVSSSGGSLGIYSNTNGRWAFEMKSGGLISVNNIIEIRNASSGSVIRPLTDNVGSCGGSSYRWTEVCAMKGTISTSDEREKDILTDMNLEDYSDLFMSINPIVYRWKYGVDDKIHFGVGAQTLKRQFEEHGYDPMAYGIIEYDELEKPTPTGQTDRYSMNYQNLQMLTLMQTQKNSRDLEFAVNRIKELEKKIMKLEQGIG